jgi:hypothetical protein
VKIDEPGLILKRNTSKIITMVTLIRVMAAPHSGLRYSAVIATALSPTIAGSSQTV